MSWRVSGLSCFGMAASWPMTWFLSRMVPCSAGFGGHVSVAAWTAAGRRNRPFLSRSPSSTNCVSRPSSRRPATAASSRDPDRHQGDRREQRPRPGHVHEVDRDGPGRRDGVLRRPRLQGLSAGGPQRFPTAVARADVRETAGSRRWVGAAALSSFSGRCSRVARQQWGVGPPAARVDIRKAAHHKETAVEVQIVPGRPPRAAIPGRPDGYIVAASTCGIDGGRTSCCLPTDLSRGGRGRRHGVLPWRLPVADRRRALEDRRRGPQGWTPCWWPVKWPATEGRHPTGSTRGSFRRRSPSRWRRSTTSAVRPDNSAAAHVEFSPRSATAWLGRGPFPRRPRGAVCSPTMTGCRQREAAVTCRILRPGRRPTRVAGAASPWRLAGPGRWRTGAPTG